MREARGCVDMLLKVTAMRHARAKEGLDDDFPSILLTREWPAFAFFLSKHPELEDEINAAFAESGNSLEFDILGL
jgi:hypothetical protein